MLLQKQKKSSSPKAGNRLLISISVLGSAGPIRFLANDKTSVLNVIETAVRNYAREGRLPVIGSDVHTFLLYSANAEAALSPWEAIGSRGGRDFVLCKKSTQGVGENESEGHRKDAMTDGIMSYGRKGNGALKTWINKSLHFKIPTH